MEMAQTIPCMGILPVFIMLAFIIAAISETWNLSLPAGVNDCTTSCTRVLGF